LGESTRREADSSRWVSSLERLLLAVMQISMSASDA